MILATPGAAPFPVREFLKLPPEQLSQRLQICGETSSPCSIPVRVGLFFDGTNNNLARDRDGEQVPVPWVEGDNARIVGGKTRLPTTQCSHSNVARLFQAYKLTDIQAGIFSYYIPGVGTRFPAIGEHTETSEGKAFAKGGQARIIFAILQVINSIHFAIKREQLFSDFEAGRIAAGYDARINEISRQEDAVSLNPHIEFFSEYVDRLERILKTTPKPSIPSLKIDVFGFSRGAAEAVAFCHLFSDLLKGAAFASVATTIEFLGIFDTVASVFLSASVSQTTFVPESWADGHFSWADRILNPLPQCVQYGRHYIAAHEQRMNFPVTTIFPADGANAKDRSGKYKFAEYYFPGVHSDVGGGYAPGEGGKGRGSQSEMLSQIPLVYMYKEALIAGVPLQNYEELEPAVKEDFEISPALASAWTAYCAALVEKTDKKQPDHGERLQRHMSLFYRWQAARLYNLEQTSFFMSASKQTQQDLRDSFQLLKGDLAVVKRRAKPKAHDPYNRGAIMEPKYTCNQWIWERSNQPLDKWEIFALSCYENKAPLDEEVVRFFDDYVHDSFAGFYLAGEVTDYDKRVKISQVLKTRPEKLNKFDRKIVALARQVEVVKNKKANGQPLSSDEEALLSEAEQGTVYPIMTDEDTADMRSWVITTQTWTRREGGGYFIRRGYYPKEGWIFFKEPKVRENLERSAKFFRVKPNQGEEDYIIAWSDNVRRDVAIHDRIAAV